MKRLPQDTYSLGRNRRFKAMVCLLFFAWVTTLQLSMTTLANASISINIPYENAESIDKLQHSRAERLSRSLALAVTGIFQNELSGDALQASLIKVLSLCLTGGQDKDFSPATAAANGHCTLCCVSKACTGALFSPEVTIVDFSYLPTLSWAFVHDDGNYSRDPYERPVIRGPPLA
jgi:hypothetical protein